MRRKNSNKAPVKSRHIDLRIDQATYDSIAGMAEYAGISVSEYIRRMLTKGRVITKEYSVFNPDELNRILFHLGHIGGNLNQIAHYLNGGGTMSWELCQDIAKAVSDIYDIKKEIIRTGGDLLGHS